MALMPSPSAAPSVVVRHLSGRAALETCAAAYDQLTEALGAPITARRPWLQTWVDCYPDWQSWVVLVERDDVPVAAAALATRSLPGLLRVVGMGYGPSDAARLLALDEEAARALAGGIADGLRGRGPWWLYLQQLPEHDRVTRHLSGVLPVSQVEPGDGMPRVCVDRRDPDAYLSKNTRKALAKIRNRLKAAGLQAELAWTQDPEDIEALQPELAAVHRARDEALGRRSDQDDPRAAAFHREVLRRHAARGEVDLLTVRLRGQLAAYVCGFRDGAALRSWDNRLAPAWAEFSAGRIANSEAVRHVVDSGHYDELDWMRGEEPYKLQSATDVVPTMHVSAWSSPAVRSALQVLARARDAAAQRAQRGRVR